MHINKKIFVAYAYNFFEVLDETVLVLGCCFNLTIREQILLEYENQI